MRNLADPALVADLRHRLAAGGTERDEALAASGEILQVINRSPGDLASVFDVVLEKATRIGEAKFRIVDRFAGDVFRVEAARDATPAFIEYLRREPPRPDSKNPPLRLAAWNRSLQELLDVPDAFLVEPLTYVDDIHRPAAGDEFCGSDIEVEIDRRLSETDQPLRLERTRPDGRVIEVRRNPMPGGGFLLICSDMTERKRAEAGMRAARDAAERALDELKAAPANLLQAEKMASVSQFSADIAHEIKSPLNFVNNFASLSHELFGEPKDIAVPALNTLEDGQRAALDEVVGMLAGRLDKILGHGRRADGIVKSMPVHSRGGSGDRQAVDLNALIEELLADHGARAQGQDFNTTLERDFDPAIKPIELVPQDMTLNLFGNGFYAANNRARPDTDGSFSPVACVTTRDASDVVEIRVRDVGVPSEIRDRLFQTFSTAKAMGEGTGLGLSISYDIVTQQHGGAIAADSEGGVFTEFTRQLPRGGIYLGKDAQRREGDRPSFPTEHRSARAHHSLV